MTGYIKTERLLALAIGAVLLQMPGALHADKLCMKARTKDALKKKVTIETTTVPSASACPDKYTEILNTETLSGLQGPTGATGAQGADGQLRVYGDGSAGPKTVSVDETLGADPAPDNDANLQYTDFTIDAGVTLTVPSGTVIRCTGTFTNNGTISVSNGAVGGRRDLASANTIDALGSDAHTGASLHAAGSGEIGDNSAQLEPGDGGEGLSETQARALRYPGAAAGGGGGCGDFNPCNSAVNGGGSLVVLCQQGVINNGAIQANGTNSTSQGGAGGGGIVILASKTSVTNAAAAAINANGGNGAPSDSDQGASGGGGGGIIHLLAPAVTNAGTASAAGGTAGAAGAAGSVTANPRSGGGGGGACGGDGGSGGSVSAVDNPNAANGGEAGYVLTSSFDPTASF
jgi:hypothetical protein